MARPTISSEVPRRSLDTRNTLITSVITIVAATRRSVMAFDPDLTYTSRGQPGGARGESGGTPLGAPAADQTLNDIDVQIQRRLSTYLRANVDFPAQRGLLSRIKRGTGNSMSVSQCL